MFCPKCGGPNQDELLYCRECGENLQVVSQAMKGHLSVAVVSKIDAVIEKKEERLRRDAFLNALMGVAFLFAGLFNLSIGASLLVLNFVWLLLGVFALGTAVWKFLGYRRSLELRTSHLRAAIDSDILSPPFLNDGDRAAASLEIIAGENRLIYCPKCGSKNPNTVSFCPSCGTDLDLPISSTALERYLPRSVVTRLDDAVAKNEVTPFKPQYKSASTILILAIIFIVNAILSGINRDLAGVITNFGIGVALVVSGSWNLVAYRRTAGKEKVLVELPPTSITDERVPYLFDQWKIVLAFVGVSFAFVLYFGFPTGMPLVLVALFILAGSYLRFRRRNREEQSRKAWETSNNEVPSLGPLETGPLHHQPLSIAESTTRFLDPIIHQIEEEKVPTTKNLANPRR
ncbi:MAG: zinc ribbon domain-containing protein [Acidobacteriota bacterium]